MTRCGEIMKANPICRPLTASVQDLANIMKNESGGPLPIVDVKNGNKLLGVVTYRDLVVGVLADEKNPVETKALDVLSHEKKYCKTGDSLGRAIALMDRFHVTELPVVDSSMHLVGTIMQSDISKRLADPELPIDGISLEGNSSEEEIRTIL